MEVLSKSTGQFDRRIQLTEYQAIPSVREILLVSQDRCRVEHDARKPRRPWTIHTLTKLQGLIAMESPACSLSQKAIYDGV